MTALEFIKDIEKETGIIPGRLIIHENVFYDPANFRPFKRVTFDGKDIYMDFDIERHADEKSLGIPVRDRALYKFRAKVVKLINNSIK